MVYPVFYRCYSQPSPLCKSLNPTLHTIICSVLLHHFRLFLSLKSKGICLLSSRRACCCCFFFCKHILIYFYPVCRHRYSIVCIWSEDNFQELALSFHLVFLGIQLGLSDLVEVPFCWSLLLFLVSGCSFLPCVINKSAA